mmetsp:Transcript_22473/g.48708  ORF Transcript_22473/g.48708 Transcript_22473/m.48708 type:complete len:376 (+) Transcript_22473:34-1161(+)
MSSFCHLNLFSIESTKFNLGYRMFVPQLLLLRHHHHLWLLLHWHLLHWHLLHLHRHHRSRVHTTTPTAIDRTRAAIHALHHGILMRNHGMLRRLPVLICHCHHGIHPSKLHPGHGHLSHATPKSSGRGDRDAASSQHRHGAAREPPGARSHRHARINRHRSDGLSSIHGRGHTHHTILRSLLQDAIVPFAFRNQSKIILHDTTPMRQLIEVHSTRIPSRISIQIRPLHTPNVGLFVSIVSIALPRIPRQYHAALGATLAFAGPAGKATSYTFVVGSRLFILAAFRPRALVKDSVLVLHYSLSVGTALVGDLARVKAKIAELIREWHLFHVAHRCSFAVCVLGGDVAASFALLTTSMLGLLVVLQLGVCNRGLFPP